MAKSLKWEFSTQFILQAKINISKLNAFCFVSPDPPQRRLNLSLLLSPGPPCLPGTLSMAFPARQTSSHCSHSYGCRSTLRAFLDPGGRHS